MTGGFAVQPDNAMIVDQLDQARITDEKTKNTLLGALQKIGPPVDFTGSSRTLLTNYDMLLGAFRGFHAAVRTQFQYVDQPLGESNELYLAATVPEDIADSADPHVMCAVAVDAVAEHFGPRLRPVAVTDSGNGLWYFVEAERSIQISFSVEVGPSASGPDDRAVTVEGHPGAVASSGDSMAYRLSTSDSPRAEATVHLGVETGPLAPPDAPLPAGTDSKAEAVLTDVLREYF